MNEEWKAHSQLIYGLELEVLHLPIFCYINQNERERKSLSNKKLQYLDKDHFFSPNGIITENSLTVIQYI